MEEVEYDANVDVNKALEDIEDGKKAKSGKKGKNAKKEANRILEGEEGK